MSTRTARPGTTITELLVMTIIGLIVMGTLFLMFHSSRAQEQNVTRFVEVQRGLRGSMALVQRDLRSLKEVVDIERESNGTLKNLSIRVPAPDGKGTVAVNYTFEKRDPRSSGIFKRNGRLLFEDCLVDFQIFPFVLEDVPREAKDSSDYARIHLFKVKLAFVPGKTEFQRVAEQRMFSFSIYPRNVNTRRKAIVSRFNLMSSRFSQSTRSTSQGSTEELE